MLWPFLLLIELFSSPQVSRRNEARIELFVVLIKTLVLRLSAGHIRLVPAVAAAASIGPNLIESNRFFNYSSISFACSFKREKHSFEA